jgi:hypothetical protein
MMPHIFQDMHNPPHPQLNCVVERFVKIGTTEKGCFDELEMLG